MLEAGGLDWLPADWVIQPASHVRITFYRFAMF